jgi:hypothetical protein
MPEEFYAVLYLVAATDTHTQSGIVAQLYKIVSLSYYTSSCVRFVSKLDRQFFGFLTRPIFSTWSNACAARQTGQNFLISTHSNDSNLVSHSNLQGNRRHSRFEHWLLAVTGIVDGDYCTIIRVL